MITNIPAYDAGFFIKNGLVWSTFTGKITQIYPNTDAGKMILGFKAVSRSAYVYLPDQFSGYLLPVRAQTQIKNVYPDNQQYARTQWQKVFNFPVGTSSAAEATDLDATYDSTTPFAPKANGIGYVAQDNPIVDFLVTSISVKETDYAFIPVGGNVG